MTTDDATRVAAWRYGGLWTVYNLASVQPILDNLDDYYAVVDDEGRNCQYLWIGVFLGDLRSGVLTTV